MTEERNERESAAAPERSDAAALTARITELEAEVERLRRENAALRKRAAAKTGRGNHMSTKLTEALRE